MNQYAAPLAPSATDTLAIAKQRAWRTLLLAIAATVLPFVASLAMTIALLARSFSTVSSASIDPSQRARLLAEGISHAMNFTIAGIVLSTLGFLFLIVAIIRFLRDSKAHGRTMITHQ